ncbi:MAG: BamA/TamA family outer membrane protein [Halioglobus sp.]
MKNSFEEFLRLIILSLCIGAVASKASTEAQAVSPEADIKINSHSEATNADNDRLISAAIIDPVSLALDQNLAQHTNVGFEAKDAEGDDSPYMILPIPSYESGFGFGLDVAALAFLMPDKDNSEAPPSQVGLMASYAENETWSAGAVGTLHLLNDDLRIDTALIYFDMNYRFWGTGGESGDDSEYIDINQKAPLVHANAKYQIFPKTYLGLGLFASEIDSTYKLRGLDLPPELEEIEEKNSLVALEIPFQYDTRSNQQYPRDGWLADASAMIYDDALGSDVDTETVMLGVNKYITVRDRDVLAFRGMTNYTGKGAPFYLQASIGGREDIRGYEYGRYTDRMSYSLQAEYRWQVSDEWILTGFLGAAEVANQYDQFFKNVLPAGGIGLRYQLKEMFDMTIAVDVAVGKHDTHFYFAIGEAF